MSNVLRKLKRQEQKKWSYEQYKRERIVRQKNSRIEKAKETFLETYNRVVPSLVPSWQVKLALFFPPRWWNNFVCFFLRIISSKENHEKLRSLNERWKKSPGLMFRFFLANIIYSVTLRSMLKLRTFIYEFGIKTKVDTTFIDDKEFIRFRIFRFFKCYHEETVAL